MCQVRRLAFPFLPSRFRHAVRGAAYGFIAPQAAKPMPTPLTDCAARETWAGTHDAQCRNNYGVSGPFSKSSFCPAADNSRPSYRFRLINSERSALATNGSRTEFLFCSGSSARATLRSAILASSSSMVAMGLLAIGSSTSAHKVSAGCSSGSVRRQENEANAVGDFEIGWAMPFFFYWVRPADARGWTCTVAVMPCTSLTPSGTTSRWIRTGTR